MYYPINKRHYATSTTYNNFPDMYKESRREEA